MQLCRNLSRCEILHYRGQRTRAPEVRGSIHYQEHCDIAMKIEHYLQVSSLLMEIHQPFNALLSYQFNFLLPLLSYFFLLFLCVIFSLTAFPLNTLSLQFFILYQISPCRMRELRGVRSRVEKPNGQEVFYVSIFCLSLSILLLYLYISRM